MADSLGATASFLCAIHCAIVPFLLALLPALNMNVLVDHNIERIFIAFASGVSLVTLIFGFQRHQNHRALGFLLPGLALLWLGALLEDYTGLNAHAVLVTVGGTLLALAHVTNLRLTRDHVHTMQCRH